MIILILWNQNTLICKSSSFLYIQPCGHSSVHSFNNDGVVHSASLKRLLKLCKIQELKMLWTGRSARCSQHTLTLCLDVVPSILPSTWSHLPPAGDQLCSFQPGVQNTWLQIWWSQNWSSTCYLVSWCHVRLCTSLCLNMVQTCIHPATIPQQHNRIE